MTIRLLTASLLCVASVQGDWWDSVTNVFGPSGQEEEQGLSPEDRFQIINAALQSNTLSPSLQMSLLIERGNLFLEMGEFQDALNDFNTVLARKPNDKDMLLEALAGQAKAQLALGKTDQYLATRTILINMAPPEGYPPESDYYYLVTFPDAWGGYNWWRNPQWRGHFHDWLHGHPHHYNNVVFSKNSVNVVQKPRKETTPSNQPVRQQPVERKPAEGIIKPQPVERKPEGATKPQQPIERKPVEVERKIPQGTVIPAERDRVIERPAERIERPQSRPNMPATRPSAAPERSDARPNLLNR